MNLQTVLIIDHNLETRRQMKEHVSQTGYAVIVADNGEAGIALFREHLPKLVIAETHLPDMKGHELCRTIRQLPEGEDMPIIIIAERNCIDSIDRAYDSGATDFILAPVKWHIFKHKLQYVLRTSSAMQSARRNERLLADAQRIAKLGNWSWDTVKKEIHVSDESYRIFGLPKTSPGIFYKMLLNAVHPDDREAFNLAVDRAKGGHPSDIEFKVLPPDGIQRTIAMHAERNNSMDADHIFGTFQDITEHRKAEEAIRQLAFYDSVTGLPNRSLFKEHLQVALKQAQRNNTRVAVMFLDLDNFKRINDSLGHKAGDQLLEETSNRLKKSIRTSDAVTGDYGETGGSSLARLGGDEFTVMLDEITDINHVNAVAERILSSLNEPVMLAGNRVVVTSSIGISIYPDDGDCIDTLLKHADAAMYQVKDKGRNGVFFYDDNLRKESQNRIQLEGELYKALKNDEMTLFYQPKVDTITQKVVGFEALIRWIHPKRGMVSPADFIPVAEDSGLIIPMGKWIIKTAAKQQKAWQETGIDPVVVSVNISCHQFADKHLLEAVREILRETGIDPNFLEFEITESILMEDAEAAMAILKELKSMGLKLSIDDFGTGYSSMSYLKHFPIDVLKIDRSFVLDIPEDEQDAVITTAIISLAKALDLNVVAEGVETEEQLQFLRNCDCEQIQGFLFSPPVPPEQAKEFLGHTFTTENHPA